MYIEKSIWLTENTLVDNDFHRHNSVFELFKDLEVKDLNVELPGKSETNGSAEQNGTATKN